VPFHANLTILNLETFEAIGFEGYGEGYGLLAHTPDSDL
jgi:hypothetical protein